MTVELRAAFPTVRAVVSAVVAVVAAPVVFATHSNVVSAIAVTCAVSLTLRAVTLRPVAAVAVKAHAMLSSVVSATVEMHASSHTVVPAVAVAPTVMLPLTTSAEDVSLSVCATPSSVVSATVVIPASSLTLRA